MSIPASGLLRTQLEAALGERIPSALTPRPHAIRPVASTHIPAIDELLQGGLPVGAISEITGTESSGRTSLALAFAAGITQAGKVCAWVDVSNALHPESAAAIGVELSCLLWVRCGVKPPSVIRNPAWRNPAWLRLDQALRVTDLLLQAGGLGAVVLDLGSIPPEYALRVPLAAWFRFRAAAERSQLNFLLLSQQACAKSSAGLSLHLDSLHLDSGDALPCEPAIFTGMEYRAEVTRQRLAQSPVFPLRKPPQRAREAQWRSRTTWAGRK